LKVFHRDLKAENILVMSHWNIKLCDFGISCGEADVKDKNLPVGTIPYMSPQYLE
jgi:serine/threonine protein kinase